MAKTIVGFEITEESVRAVEVSRGKRPTLIAAGEVPLPPGAAKDSEVLDQDAVAMAIAQLWSQAGIKAKEVVVGISNRRILVREHSTPALRPDLLRAALPFDVQDLLPVPPEQAVLDFYPIAESDGHVHGLLVAAVAETVESIISVLKRARLRAAAVDFIPFGLARVARMVAQPGQTVAVVAIGEHTTNLVVAQDGIPRFARIIPVDLGISNLDVPDQAPTPDGPEPLPQARRALGVVADTAAPSVADLIGRLRNTLSFYASRPGVAAVETLYLTGAGIGAPGLLQLAGDTLGIQLFTVDANNLVPPATGALPAGKFASSIVTTIGVILGEGE